MSYLFFRPSGARSSPTWNPHLTVWAAFLRRFAAMYSGAAPLSCSSRSYDTDSGGTTERLTHTLQRVNHCAKASHAAVCPRATHSGCDAMNKRPPHAKAGCRRRWTTPS